MQEAEDVHVRLQSCLLRCLGLVLEGQKIFSGSTWSPRGWKIHRRVLRPWADFPQSGWTNPDLPRTVDRRVGEFHTSQKSVDGTRQGGSQITISGGTTGSRMDFEDVEGI